MAVRISDFEKDKALLDKHIAEQQPDILKLTLEEEGWGSRPMITLMPVDLLERSPGTTTNTASVPRFMFRASCDPSKRSMRVATPWRIRNPGAGERFICKVDGREEDALCQHADHR